MNHRTSTTQTHKQHGAWTRRGFLGASVKAGAAALAMPTIVTSRAWGANDRIVLGGIGVGNQGHGLLRGFRGHDARIAAVADVNLSQARRVGGDLEADGIYQDYRQMLDRDDIDAVVIATPHHWHALQCIHAAQAGKDIYCEKPLSYTIREGRMMAQAVRKYDRVLQTGSQQRSGNREYRGIMHVRNGSMGKLTKVQAHNYYSPMEHGHPEEPVPDGLDWRAWCGPAGEQPYTRVIFNNRSDPSWVSIRPFSGGNMLDWGGHGLDIVQWGLGMDESGPVEIWTEGEPMTPIISTPDNPGGRQKGPRSPRVSMKYANGVVLELFGSDVGGSGARFVGEDGAIVVRRGRSSADPSELFEQPLEDLPQQLQRSSNHHRDWLEAIRERRDPIASVEAGHRTASIGHLANIARWVTAVTGVGEQSLRWDPEAERFTNNDVANRFLSRSAPAPYDLPEQV